MKFLKLIFGFAIVLMLANLGCEKSDELLNGSDESLLKKGKPAPKNEYPFAETPAQIDIYGVWHAGNDYCTWGTPRDTAGEFNTANHWLIDRGDGIPSVNLVVLSFVNPLDLLLNTSEDEPLGGIPAGMNEAVVKYFKNRDIRVMLSIGGITYTDDWNAALAENPIRLANNAVLVAKMLGVGIEIDYEENRNPNLQGLQTFIETYRDSIAYDPSGENHAARLTIDLAAGDRWLIDICRKATADWLQTSHRVLDYANAMVPARQPSESDALANWYEHIEGKAQYAPPILPLAPCKFTGALYLNDRKEIPECVDFSKSLQNLTSDFVRKIESEFLDATPGMLGYMFWAAECPSTRKVCATDCTGGVGEGAIQLGIEVPMPALRQN